eukprot:4246944-Heterocapsa_arctica.AAC.1
MKGCIAAQAKSKPASQPGRQAASQPAKQPASQPVGQGPGQPASQPTNKPCPGQANHIELISTCCLTHILYNELWQHMFDPLWVDPHHVLKMDLDEDGEGYIEASSRFGRHKTGHQAKKAGL